MYVYSYVCADIRYRVSKYKQKTWKNIPDIIDRNLKKDQQILVIFGRNISDTTGY